MYREEQSGAGFMMGMLAGAFVGAGLALLLAPRSGQEIRQQIGAQYRGLADRVGSQAHEWREKASQLREQGRERLQQMRGHQEAASEESTTTRSETGHFPPSAPSV